MAKRNNPNKLATSLLGVEPPKSYSFWGVRSPRIETVGKGLPTFDSTRSLRAFAQQPHTRSLPARRRLSSAPASAIAQVDRKGPSNMDSMCFNQMAIGLLVSSHFLKHTHIHMFTHGHTHIHICMYIYI